MAFAAKYQLILSLEYTDKTTFEKVLGPENATKLMALDIKNVINDIDFEFSMDAMKIQSIATKMQQSMQLLEIAPKLVDAAGNPLVDMKPVVDFLLQGMGMGESVELSDESIQESIQKAVAMKKAFADAS